MIEVAKPIEVTRLSREDLKKGTYQVELVALQKTTIKMKHKSETVIH